MINLFKKTFILLAFFSASSSFAFFLQSRYIVPPESVSAVFYVDGGGAAEGGSFLRIYVGNYQESNHRSVINFEVGRLTGTTPTQKSHLIGIETPNYTQFAAVNVKWLCMVGIFHPVCLSPRVDSFETHAFDALYAGDMDTICIPDVSRTFAIFSDLQLTCMLNNSLVSGPNSLTIGARLLSPEPDLWQMQFNCVASEVVSSPLILSPFVSGILHRDTNYEFTMNSGHVFPDATISCKVGSAEVSLPDVGASFYSAPTTIAGASTEIISQARKGFFTFSPIGDYVIDRARNPSRRPTTGRLVYVRKN